jgi:hypothetical protein
MNKTNEERKRRKKTENRRKSKKVSNEALYPKTKAPQKE